MLLISLLFHLLIQPVYADEATPSATPIVVKVTEIPTMTPIPSPTDTPIPTITPTVTPVVSVNITIAPRISLTPVKKQEATTPTPTKAPVFSLNQITTPTPTPKTTHVIAHIASFAPKPIVAQIAKAISFPEDFFSYAKQGNYYPDSSLPKEQTRTLLEVSAGSLVMGLLLINWDFLAAALFRLFKRKQLAFAVSEIAQENLE